MLLSAGAVMQKSNLPKNWVLMLTKDLPVNIFIKQNITGGISDQYDRSRCSANFNGTVYGIGRRKISASLMCLGFDMIPEHLKIFKENKIEFLHVDVMDGAFVPNFAYGPDFIKRTRPTFSIVCGTIFCPANPGFTHSTRTPEI